MEASIKNVFDLVQKNNLEKVVDILTEKIFPAAPEKKGNENDEYVATELQPAVIKFIPDLIPVISNLMKSKDKNMQIAGAYFLTFIALSGADTKAYVDGMVMAGAVPLLIKLLSSPDNEVVEEALGCLVNLTYYFPEEAVQQNGLPPLTQFMESSYSHVSCPAIKCLSNISESTSNILPMIKVGIIKTCLEVAETSLPKNYKKCQYIFEILNNIAAFDAKMCQKLINFGKNRSKPSRILTIVKSIINTPNLKSCATKFVKTVTSFGQTVTVIAEDDFVGIIVKQINDRKIKEDEIKIDSVQIVQNIIKMKPEFVQVFIIEHNIVQNLICNLHNKNPEVLKIVLTVLSDFLGNVEYAKTTLQQFEDCKGPEKLEKLLKHSDEEIRQLSNRINKLVDVEDDVEELQHLGGDKSNESAKTLDALQQEEAPPSSSSVESVKFPCRVELEKRELKRKRPSIASFETTKNKRSRDSVAPSETSSESDNNKIHTNLQDFDSTDLCTTVCTNTPESVNLEDCKIEIIEIIEKIEPDPFPISSSIQQCLQEAMALSTEKNQIQDNVTSIEYNCPSEFFFKKCGDFLGINFCREDYCKFVQRIKITQIKSNSKPTQTASKNGFSSLSIFFTGNESQTSLIQKQINNYFVENSGIEKLKQVFGLTGLTFQHLEVIADWWKCQILYFSNGTWNKLSDWSIEETPLLVFKESESQNYEIVSSLENE